MRMMEIHNQGDQLDLHVHCWNQYKLAQPLSVWQKLLQLNTHMSPIQQFHRKPHPADMYSNIHGSPSCHSQNQEQSKFIHSGMNKLHSYKKLGTVTRMNDC